MTDPSTALTVLPSPMKGVRDLAIFRLLFDLALRREEVASLDLGDLDLESETVSILGKGKRERTELTLPVPTRVALEDWLLVRGGGRMGPCSRTATGPER